MEEKSAVIERFMRTLKNKIYKYMNSILKTCILINQMINKHNNAYHRTNKMKPIDVKSSTYDDFNVENMIKTIPLKLMIMWEYQNIKSLLQKVTL